jgi:hypothetical protein
MTKRQWDGTAAHARVIHAEDKPTRYCDECGHPVDRHKRVERAYACSFYGCGCKISKMKYHKQEKDNAIEK